MFSVDDDDNYIDLSGVFEELVNQAVASALLKEDLERARRNLLHGVISGEAASDIYLSGRLK